MDVGRAYFDVLLAQDSLAATRASKKAYENQLEIDPARKAFYEYHSMLMEPWDGPAALVFTDGSLVGATLDRNGLRPGRYLVTDDGLVVLASEIGVLDIDPSKVVRKGRLRPGKMFLVDTAEGRLIEDDEIASLFHLLQRIVSGFGMADLVSFARERAQKRAGNRRVVFNKQ